MIPSGTKTSKIFSQKPVNGDGDFTFSRSTAATRVNADGVIEKETQNLLRQSNNFNTTWVKNAGATLVSGQSGYDGSNDAWRINVTTTSNSGLYQYLSSTSSGVNTISLYAKAGDINYIGFTDFAGSNWYIWFDLSNGTIASQSGYIDSSITDVGGGWYRLSMTSTDLVIFQIKPSSVAANPSSSAGYIFIQDAQAEQGLVARDYIETTTTAVEGGITDNVPRLDYTDASCPSLLLEPQRTNLSLQSEYFDVAPSVKDASTIEVNGTTSPSGLDDACLFTETTANDRHGFYQYITISAGALTASIFTKEIDRRYIHFQSNATGSGENSYVDLQDGSVVREGSGWSLSTEDYGNGWYRIKATCTAVAGNKYFIWGVSQNGTTNSYAGSTSKDFTFYGFQLEAGSYATSYIPTYGSAVTRNGEGSSNSVANTTSRTYFLEGKRIADANFSSSSGFYAPNDNLNITFWSNNRLRFRFGGAINQYYILAGDDFKIAVSYDGTDSKVFVNGQLAFTQTFDLANVTSIILSGNNGAVSYNQTLLFPTALTDQEAIDLTTL